MDLKTQAVKGSTHKDIQRQRGKRVPQREEGNGRPGQTRVSSHGSNHEVGTQRLRPTCNHMCLSKPRQRAVPSAWYRDQGHQTGQNPTYQIYRLAIPLLHTTILHMNDLPARIDVIPTSCFIDHPEVFSLFFFSSYRPEGMPRQFLGQWPATYAQTYFSISGYFQSLDHSLVIRRESYPERRQT